MLKKIIGFLDAQQVVCVIGSVLLKISRSDYHLSEIPLIYVKTVTNEVKFKDGGARECCFDVAQPRLSANISVTF